VGHKLFTAHYDHLIGEIIEIFAYIIRQIYGHIIMKKRIENAKIALLNILKLSAKEESISRAESAYKKEIPQKTKDMINDLFLRRASEIKELAKS
jgi:hypothetical protein